MTLQFHPHWYECHLLKWIANFGVSVTNHASANSRTVFSSSHTALTSSQFIFCTLPISYPSLEGDSAAEAVTWYSSLLAMSSAPLNSPSFSQEGGERRRVFVSRWMSFAIFCQRAQALFSCDTLRVSPGARTSTRCLIRVWKNKKGNKTGEKS